MIYDIRVQGWRPFSVSERQVVCKNASTLGYGKYIARPGYWISFTTGLDGHAQTRTGRVLGRIESPSDVCGWLYVLSLSPAGDYLQPLWVNPEWVATVQESSRVPRQLLAWFTQSELPAPDLVAKLAEYGSLSESYIGAVVERQTAFEHGVSPQGFDALMQADPATWPKPFLHARIKVSRRQIADLNEDHRAAMAAANVAEVTRLNAELATARAHHRELFRLLKVYPPVPLPEASAGTVGSHG